MAGDLRHVALQRIGAREIALDGHRQGRVGRGTFVAGIEGDRLGLQDLRLERLSCGRSSSSCPGRAGSRTFAVACALRGARTVAGFPGFRALPFGLICIPGRCGAIQANFFAFKQT